MPASSALQRPLAGLFSDVRVRVDKWFSVHEGVELLALEDPFLLSGDRPNYLTAQNVNLKYVVFND